MYNLSNEIINKIIEIKNKYNVNMDQGQEWIIERIQI